MRPIDPDGFEALFRRSTDPWDYAASPFEAAKRKALLNACGSRIHARGLELGCANGETSRHLARRCLGLIAVDASSTVIAAARRRIHDPRIRFEVARLPEDMPRGRFDLIVMSELLYYLPAGQMERLLGSVLDRLSRGGRIVILNHTVWFDDAAQSGERAHARALLVLGRRLEVRSDRRTARYRVSALQ